jgi:hypothetical protein
MKSKFSRAAFGRFLDRISDELKYLRKVGFATVRDWGMSGLELAEEFLDEIEEDEFDYLLHWSNQGEILPAC